MVYGIMGMTDGEMIEKHSITEARRNLTKPVRQAEGGKTMALTRCGNPVAVLAGRRTFGRLAAGRRGFVEACGNFVGTVDLPEKVFNNQFRIIENNHSNYCWNYHQYTVRKRYVYSSIISMNDKYFHRHPECKKCETKKCKPTIQFTFTSSPFQKYAR